MLDIGARAQPLFAWFLDSSPLIAFYPLFVIWVGLGPEHRDGDRLSPFASS